MKNLVVLSLCLIGLSFHAQSSFMFGVNIGGFKAHNKTAAMYNGFSLSNPDIGYYRYGIDNIFNNPLNKPDIDDHFQYPYSIAEYPSDLRYRPGFDIGGMVGLKDEEGTVYFIEANFAQLKVEDVYVVEIEDPNNLQPGNVLEQNGIVGNEQRLNLNLGVNIPIAENNGFETYIPLFANMTSTQVRDNYIFVGTQRYTIQHTIQGITNPRVGGVGFGAGTGIGVSYDLDKYRVGAFYKAIYSKTYMLEDFQEYGLNHSLGISVVWG